MDVDIARVCESLREWRVGSVPYLNARPLTVGIADDLVFDVPARLAKRFARGELDAALVPVFEAVSRASATIADDIAIACEGEVYSVFLATREPVDSLESVALDPDSRTSSHLVQCLFAEFLEQDVTFTERPVDENQARLLIGDPAMTFRAEDRNRDWTFVDLGAEWLKWTGLPFVFACWVLRPGGPDPVRLAGLLRDAKRHGVASRPEIAKDLPDPDLALRYLSENVRYDLREREKEAIALFASLLRKHGLTTESADPELRYV